MSVQDESPFELFRRTLKVSPEVATSLVDGELTSVEEVAYIPFAELSEITGLPEKDLLALRQIASLYLLNTELGGFPDD